MENQSEAIDNIEFNNDLHLSTKISPTTEHELKGNNQNDRRLISYVVSDIHGVWGGVQHFFNIKKIKIFNDSFDLNKNINLLIS